MPIRLVYTPIVPQAMKIGKVRLQVLNELRKQGRAARREFEKTTGTWKKERPKFGFEISLAGGDAKVQMTIGGPLLGQKKWLWLEEGTRVRHALMSKDFRRKTHPGQIQAGGGGGPQEPIWVNKRYVNQPGIRKRRWRKAIIEVRRKPFSTGIERAIRQGVKKLF